MSKKPENKHVLIGAHQQSLCVKIQTCWSEQNWSFFWIKDCIYFYIAGYMVICWMHINTVAAFNLWKTNVEYCCWSPLTLIWYVYFQKSLMSAQTARLKCLINWLKMKIIKLTHDHKKPQRFQQGCAISKLSWKCPVLWCSFPLARTC